VRNGQRTRRRAAAQRISSIRRGRLVRLHRAGRPEEVRGPPCGCEADSGACIWCSSSEMRRNSLFRRRQSGDGTHPHRQRDGSRRSG
jgi:hypothetical protein